MDMPRLSKSVRTITVFERDSTGSRVPVVVFDRRRKRKKQSKGLKPFERSVRMVADAFDRTASTYATRHRRSNRKHKDGWLRDIVQNAVKAGDKGRKKLDPSRMLGW